MPRRPTAELSIRSAYALARAAELARRTGRSTTEVVEAALRAYEPFEGSSTAIEQPPTVDGLIVFDDGVSMSAEDFVEFVALERTQDRGDAGAASARGT